MARICPNCGTRNKMGNNQCPKCGNSLLSVIDSELIALKDMRVYSIIVLVFAIFGTLSFALNILNSGSIASGGLFAFLGLGVSGSLGTTITTIFIFLEVVIIASLFFQIVSYIYLRSCFSKLRPTDFNFSSPKTGTTLLIIGLVLAMVGIAVLLALVIPLIASSPGSITTQTPFALAVFALAGFVVVIGGILTLIGYIMGVLLGTHRMATKFEEPMFDIGWILLIVSLFFSPLALAAGILFLQGANTTRRRLIEVKSGATVQPS